MSPMPKCQALHIVTRAVRRSFKTILASSSFLACNSRLRSAIRRHHPPQRAVLSQIWWCFRSCWMAEPRDAWHTYY